jgi:tetratricopeptide (TPR) repeat protein
LSLGDGGRAWNVAPSNSEIRKFEDWKILAQILNECAAQLSFESSEILSRLNRTNCLSSSNEDREHRIFLIAWNLDFLDLINESLTATGFQNVEQQELRLTPKERHEVQLNILLARKRDLKNRGDNDRRMVAVEQIIQLLKTELPEKCRQLSDLLQEQGELLESCGRSSDAMEAYLAAINIEPDPDLKEALVELVNEKTNRF